MITLNCHLPQADTCRESFLPGTLSNRMRNTREVCQTREVGEMTEVRTETSETQTLSQPRTREVRSKTANSVVPCETVAQPKESNVSPLSVQKTQTGERQRRSVIVCTAQSSLVYPGMTQCSQPTSLYPVSAQSFLRTSLCPH